MKLTSFSDQRPTTYVPQIILGFILHAISNGMSASLLAAGVGVVGLILGLTGIANFAVYIKHKTESIWMGVLMFVITFGVYGLFLALLAGEV